jgi:C-terminal processing protease CtpA/Prc
MTTGRAGRAGWIGAAFALGLAAPPAPAVGPGWWPALLPADGWEAKAAPTRPQRSQPAPLTPAQLRGRAAAAEAAGDWEGAFAAYHDLYRLDRTSPGVRDRLFAALRRVQQVRRHRDPVYRQYAAGLTAADAVGLFGELAGKVPGLHADPARSTPQQLWANGVEELARAVDDVGFRRAFLGDPPADAVTAYKAELLSAWSRRSIPDAREARSTLKQLLAATLDHFPAAGPSAVAVEFVCGACAGLDEYTVFLPPAAGPDPADLSAWGLTVAAADIGWVVEAVAPHSWAARQTALRPGDRVVRVNGRAEDLGDALRSPAGGFHEVEWVAADGGDAVVRLPAVVPSVYGGRLVESKDGGVGYLRVGEFRDTTPRELVEEVAALRGSMHGARVLILDLRGNAGGSFPAAVETARRLLPAGEVAGTQGQHPAVAGQVFASAAGPTALDIPLVVLIDGETASAAEVVAAALKGNGRAVLVGTPTFGKGAIQYPLRLAAADDGDKARAATVRLTIARLLGPRGVPLDGVGVSPHVTAVDPASQWEAALQQAAALVRPLPMPMPMMPPSDVAATVSP